MGLELPAVLERPHNVGIGSESCSVGLLDGSAEFAPKLYSKLVAIQRLVELGFVGLHNVCTDSIRYSNTLTENKPQFNFVTQYRPTLRVAVAEWLEAR